VVEEIERDCGEEIVGQFPEKLQRFNKMVCPPTIKGGPARHKEKEKTKIARECPTCTQENHSENSYTCLPRVNPKKKSKF
jgi:hypothetical protein